MTASKFLNDIYLRERLWLAVNRYDQLFKHLLDEMVSTYRIDFQTVGLE